MGISFSLSAPSRSRRRADRRPLAVLALLAAFVLLVALWVFLVPLPTDDAVAAGWGNYHPDEHNHLRVIVYIATERALPPFAGFPPQSYYTAVHPPLYHLLGALVYGAVSPGGGHAAALLALRLLSCAMGVGTVWLTYRAARCLLPFRPALLAAGCVAGVPMFVSLSGAITNEILTALAAAGALASLIFGLRRGFTARRVLAVSAWVAAGAATKVTCLGLIPAALLALWWAGRERRLPAAAVGRQMLTVLGIVSLATGWWFVRNQALYGDPLMRTAHLEMWRRFAPGYAVAAAGDEPARQAATLLWYKFTPDAAYDALQTGVSAPRYLLLITELGWESFWGIFDAFSRPFSGATYLCLGLVQAAALAGFLRLWRRGGLKGSRGAAAAVMALFAAFVVGVFYAFNGSLYSPQGRYFFPLLLPFGLLTAAGWWTLFPRRLRPVAAAALLAALLLLNLYASAVMSVRPEQTSARPPAFDAPRTRMV